MIASSESETLGSGNGTQSGWWGSVIGQRILCGWCGVGEQNRVGASRGLVLRPSGADAGPLLPQCYPEHIAPRQLDPEVVEGLEPALGIEPRTC